jgi:hypothetical protein
MMHADSTTRGIGTQWHHSTPRERESGDGLET